MVPFGILKVRINVYQHSVNVTRNNSRNIMLIRSPPESCYHLIGRHVGTKHILESIRPGLPRSLQSSLDMTRQPIKVPREIDIDGIRGTRYPLAIRNPALRSQNAVPRSIKSGNLGTLTGFPEIEIGLYRLGRFPRIADIDPSRIQISWKIRPCGFSTEFGLCGSTTEIRPCGSTTAATPPERQNGHHSHHHNDHEFLNYLEPLAKRIFLGRHCTVTQK